MINSCGQGEVTRDPVYGSSPASAKSIMMCEQVPLALLAATLGSLTSGTSAYILPGGVKPQKIVLSADDTPGDNVAVKAKHCISLNAELCGRSGGIAWRASIDQRCRWQSAKVLNSGRNGRISGVGRVLCVFRRRFFFRSFILLHELLCSRRKMLLQHSIPLSRLPLLRIKHH